MPFDSNGNFTRTQNWTSDFENGIEIVCDRHDDEDDNFANGFNECMLRDGRAPATGNLKLGNFRITGMADGQTSNDAINKGQLDALNSLMIKNINSLTDTIKTTLETIFPIGSLYIGTQKTCPMGSLIKNSEWQLVSKNKALWTGDGTNANTTIDAGLPNITGGAQVQRKSGNDFVEGAFYLDGEVVSDRAANGSMNKALKFDASRSNPIYGNSTTVQPPAYVVNVWRRIA
jgi:hypothetical protein